MKVPADPKGRDVSGLLQALPRDLGDPHVFRVELARSGSWQRWLALTVAVASLLPIFWHVASRVARTTAGEREAREWVAQAQQDLARAREAPLPPSAPPGAALTIARVGDLQPTRAQFELANACLASGEDLCTWDDGYMSRAEALLVVGAVDGSIPKDTPTVIHAHTSERAGPALDRLARIGEAEHTLDRARGELASVAALGAQSRQPGARLILGTLACWLLAAVLWGARRRFPVEVAQHRIRLGTTVLNAAEITGCEVAGGRLVIRLLRGGQHLTPRLASDRGQLEYTAAQIDRVALSPADGVDEVRARTEVERLHHALRARIPSG